MQTLTLKQLNRTLLSRQLLLKRHIIPPLAAIEKLIALQSQIPNPPYIGLWTRLQTFQRDDLTQLMESRQVVRAPFLRSTLHLVSADDHQSFRSILQPALVRAFKAFNGKQAKGLNIEQLVDIAKPFLENEPATTGELRDVLTPLAPDRIGNTLVTAVRTYLPCVQVPPGGTWGAGTRASYTTAEQWLGEARPADLRTLLHRYLAAFGPASVMDFQAWTGLVSLKQTIEPFKKDLVVYQGKDGKELLDLPDMPILADDTPAPIRFIPEYDNLLVSHKDRRRVIADDHRKKVFLSAARVLGTVLIDGFVGATWKSNRDKDIATLNVSLFESYPDDILEQIEAEGQQLLRFIEDDADELMVQFD